VSATAHDFDEFADFLHFFAAFDPDQARDSRGRWISSGSGDAAAASGKAKKTGKSEHDEKAAEAHRKAAEFHSKEVARRSELLKHARTKKDRERHAKAIEKHGYAALHHSEQAEKHRKMAEFSRKVEHPTLKNLGIDHSVVERGTVEAAERAIVLGGFGPHLARSPLERIDNHGPVSAAGRRTPNGVYAHPKARAGKISIKNTEAAARTFDRTESHWAKIGGRQQLGGEDVFSVSTLARTPEEMRQRTMVHELSHHIHLDEKDPLPVKHWRDIKKAYRKRVAVSDTEASLRHGAWVPSTYAMADHKEWFAELHTAYVFHGKELQAHDPEAYSLVQAVREARGMKP
jgi:hypothetical protein